MKRKLLFFGLLVARKKKHFSKNCQKACHHTAQRPDIAYVHVLHITHYAPITYIKSTISTLYTQIVDILGGSWVKGLVRVKTTSNRKKIM